MKKILIVITMFISIYSLSFSAIPFKGNLPYMSGKERYEDPFFPTSDLTRFIYKTFSEPYSLSWLETYVDKEMLPTFLMYHQQDISLLLEREIIGVVVTMKESYSIVKIDVEGNGNIESMWRKNDDNRYVMFSLNKTN